MGNSLGRFSSDSAFKRSHFGEGSTAECVSKIAEQPQPAADEVKAFQQATQFALQNGCETTEATLDESEDYMESSEEQSASSSQEARATESRMLDSTSSSSAGGGSIGWGLVAASGGDSESAVHVEGDASSEQIATSDAASSASMASGGSELSSTASTTRGCESFKSIQKNMMKLNQNINCQMTSIQSSAKSTTRVDQTITIKLCYGCRAGNVKADQTVTMDKLDVSNVSSQEKQSIANSLKDTMESTINEVANTTVARGAPRPIGGKSFEQVKQEAIDSVASINETSVSNYLDNTIAFNQSNEIECGICDEASKLAMIKQKEMILENMLNTGLAQLEIMDGAGNPLFPAECSWNDNVPCGWDNGPPLNMDGVMFQDVTMADGTTQKRPVVCGGYAPCVTAGMYAKDVAAKYEAMNANNPITTMMGDIVFNQAAVIKMASQQTVTNAIDHMTQNESFREFMSTVDKSGVYEAEGVAAVKDAQAKMIDARMGPGMAVAMGLESADVMEAGTAAMKVDVSGGTGALGTTSDVTNPELAMAGQVGATAAAEGVAAITKAQGEAGLAGIAGGIVGGMMGALLLPLIIGAAVLFGGPMLIKFTPIGGLWYSIPKPVRIMIMVALVSLIVLWIILKIKGKKEEEKQKENFRRMRLSRFRSVRRR